MKLILTAHVHSYNHTIIFERFPFNEFIENKINLTYNLHKLINFNNDLSFFQGNKKTIQRDNTKI